MTLPRYDFKFFTLVILTVLIGCAHDYNQEIEKALNAEAFGLDLNQEMSAKDYAEVISRLGLSSSKRIALHRIQQELTEELALLKIEEQRVSHVLSQELLNTPYNRGKVKALMQLMINKAKKASQLKLTAMLKAKNIIRNGLSGEELSRVKLSQDAVLLLRPDVGRF